MINLNNEYIYLWQYTNGRHQNIEVRLGRKLYLVDIYKNSSTTRIDFYKKQGTNRGKYSKYDEGSVLSVYVKPDVMLGRNFFENIREIKEAQETLDRFKYYV